ncbi:aspartic peptidase domain-containing protein [Flammula alnicola]|nr:aspartic peptidase domain-containing protein [Flammula alnicola]
MPIGVTAIIYVFSSLVALSTGISAYPQGRLGRSGLQHPGYDITIKAIGAPKSQDYKTGGGSSIIGIGNNFDILYTVPIELGNKVFPVNLDTGSSDLWVVSDKCETNACKDASVTRYPQSSLLPTGNDVDMHYGDSTTGTFASGTVGLDTATIAGIAVPKQAFGLIEDTTNLLVQFDAAGIFGLSFPVASRIQQVLEADKTGSIIETDDFITATYSNGPLLSRIVMAGALENPIFSVSLQRNAVDTEIGGNGLFTVGKLPEGISDSSLTWVPVRLYTAEDGGVGAPSFAPDEVYPYHWEIDIDGVFLDGQRLPDSTIPADGVDSQRVSALIDTGNSLLRGPEDVVNRIFSTVSTSYNINSQGFAPTVPCNTPHTLAFQIGGELFPIDPRDFISQLDPENAVTCYADNLVTTDPPTPGSLFRWSLGVPFFRSNLVAFHYGNLTHPSVDPPRIGIRSNVPSNADELLENAVQKALQNGGNFSKAYMHEISIDPFPVDGLEPAHPTSSSPENQVSVSASTSPIFTPIPKSCTAPTLLHDNKKTSVASCSMYM